MRQRRQARRCRLQIQPEWRRNINRPPFIVLALILLCCGGCSGVALGYNYADWLLRYRINDYTSFSSTQKTEIHHEVDSYMRWHRKYALPEYTVLLQELGEAINRDGAVTEIAVARLRTESHKLYELTMTPMIRPAAHVLSTLNSRQIAELADKFADKSREEREKMLADSEQEMHALRAERHVEFVEQLTGRLSAAQEKAITGMSLHIPFATRHYIEQREAKQAALIALLNAGAGEDRIAALLRRWITAPESFRSAQQQQAIAAYEDAMNGMTVRIFELLSASQKQHLSEKVAGYIGDFQKLTAQNDTELAAYELPRTQ